MLQRAGWRRVASMVAGLVLSLLAGCGGMADSEDQTEDPVDPPNVVGQVSFDFVPTVVTATSVSLDHGAVQRLAARFVVVEAVSANNQELLASTVTNENGNYSLVLPKNTSVRLRAKAKMESVSGNKLEVVVVDNTNANAQWAVLSEPFDTGDGNAVTQNLNAGSGWTGNAYNDSARAAGPFAILDTIYRAVEKVAAADSDADFPALTVYWSPQNVSGSGDDPIVGQIGTSHFIPADRNNGPRLYLLGKQDNDTDEYDRHVIAHEFGHYLQSAFSRDDSIGGQHGAGDMLDLRVAFSEGWGNGWAGIALNNPVYTDTLDAAQANGSQFDVSVGAESNPGWFSEDSIQKLFWDMSRKSSIGFAAIWTTLKTGLTQSSALSSIHSFAFAMNQQIPAAGDDLITILAGQDVALPTDPYGSGETNLGSPPIGDLSPLYLDHGGAGTTLSGVCVNNSNDPQVDNLRFGNRSGEFRFIKVTLAAGAHSFIVTTSSTYNSKTTPIFALYGKDGEVAESANDRNNNQTLNYTAAAGDYVLALTDRKLSAENSDDARACFNVEIR